MGRTVQIEEGSEGGNLGISLGSKNEEGQGKIWVPREAVQDWGCCRVGRWVS